MKKKIRFGEATFIGLADKRVSVRPKGIYDTFTPGFRIGLTFGSSIAHDPGIMKP